MTLLCNFKFVHVQSHPALEGRGGMCRWGAAGPGHRTLNTALHSYSCKDWLQLREVRSANGCPRVRAPRFQLPLPPCALPLSEGTFVTRQAGAK